MNVSFVPADANATTFTVKVYNAAGVPYTMSTSNVTLTATWTADVYTVSFQALYDGGFIISGANPDPTTLPSGSSYTIPGSTGALVARGGTFLDRVAYTPACLVDQHSASCHTYRYTPGESITVTEDVILTSDWTANASVYYDGNSSDGGSAPTVQTSIEVQPISVESNTFTNTGFHFTGWNTQADGHGTPYSVGVP